MTSFLLNVRASVEFTYKIRDLLYEDLCWDPVVYRGMVFLLLGSLNVVVEGREGFFGESQCSCFNAEATHVRTSLWPTRPELFLPDVKQGRT